MREQRLSREKRKGIREKKTKRTYRDGSLLLILIQFCLLFKCEKMKFNENIKYNKNWTWVRWIDGDSSREEYLARLNLPICR